eukprot:CAMPEP_0183355070 /NCGR_PEP_ID=MMETSP0164_2-20130417/39098_1 /TAXON_ID=221442 /ORGANISM="Coccolithus pelagicus ssp braarudi, Strain PLY182g" /LENGTH=59 /DNA_ID=CAMNT_0025528085 /DNA_START=313 /DNA_END=488 /DNA_ORIENTATION=+
MSVEGVGTLGPTPSRARGRETHTPRTASSVAEAAQAGARAPPCGAAPTSVGGGRPPSWR